MNLIDLIYPHNRIVSIVGTAKNAGKTVTLNEIAAQSDMLGIKLGLISTGRDGERRDVLTLTEKPPIYVKKGTIITTVENVIKSSTKKEFANIEILSVTDYTTPMGRVVIGKAVENGYVEISGPYSSSTLRQICDEMLTYGAQLILVDGSLDRRASAAPYVSDATILATGASLSRNLDLIVQKTVHIVNTYSTKKLESGFCEDIVRSIAEAGKTAVVDRFGSVKYIDTATTLKCGEQISEDMDENTEYVVLSGSATFDSIKTILLNKKSDFKIAVKDPTKIFISFSEYPMLQKMGMDLRVIDSVNIIAVTVNPYSPEGYYFASDEFVNKIKALLPNIPILDVMQEV